MALCGFNVRAHKWLMLIKKIITTKQTNLPILLSISVLISFLRSSKCSKFSSISRFGSSLKIAVKKRQTFEKVVEDCRRCCLCLTATSVMLLPPMLLRQKNSRPDIGANFVPAMPRNVAYQVMPFKWHEVSVMHMQP